MTPLGTPNRDPGVALFPKSSVPKFFTNIPPITPPAQNGIGNENLAAETEFGAPCLFVGKGGVTALGAPN